jgi:hypothetical protein
LWLLIQHPYTTPDQLKLYSAYKKRNKYTKMSGDSTGGVARKLRKDEEGKVATKCFEIDCAFNRK